MADRPAMSLGTRRTSQGAALVDLACGSCRACVDGATLWCQRPGAEGHDLTPVLRADCVEEAAAALLGLAGLAEVPADTTVLVLAAADGPLAALVPATVTGRVVVTTDPEQARGQLADEPTGRAGVVVAGADARAAVRLVRRGGHVCVTRPESVLPSVTELVQREVTLVAPQDAAGAARRLDPRLWAAFTAA